MTQSSLLFADETNRRPWMFLTLYASRQCHIPAPAGIDMKAIGYLISIVSVLLLGAVAWPKENPPAGIIRR